MPKDTATLRTKSKLKVKGRQENHDVPNRLLDSSYSKQDGITTTRLFISAGCGICSLQHWHTQEHTHKLRPFLKISRNSLIGHIL